MQNLSTDLALIHQKMHIHAWLFMQGSTFWGLEQYFKTPQNPIFWYI